MIAELGQLALVIAFAVALVQSTLPLYGAAKRDRRLIELASTAAMAQLLFLSLAFGILIHLYAISDFSVTNVYNNSHSTKPLIYKISGTWGNHEGSLVMWVWILALFGAAVAVFGRSMPAVFKARTLAVQGMIGLGFLAFMLWTSNPFLRMDPIPLDGRGLNPILQDPGLAIHPPMLYVGYVGFSTAFSFAIAALIEGRVDAVWARWLRPWTLAAWISLTLGIALGSWWAYYELGWGGWWFWDPVENASLMPWLLGTALVHSLAVSEKRNMFKRWTLILAIFSFSLSLLGTFLVRSGVLTSVHAFASDPERGLFILLFLFIVIGSSLLLYGLRMKDMEASPGFELVSRETALLINNVLFVLMCAVVLLGTLYPLVVDMLDMGSVSVGPPYFNLFSALIFGPMLLIMAPGQTFRWKRDDKKTLKKAAFIPFLLSIVFSVLLGFLIGEGFSMLVAIGTFIALWILAHGVQDSRSKMANAPDLLSGVKRLSLSYWGMQLGHFGVAVCVIGVMYSIDLSESRDVRLSAGDQYELGSYSFQLERYHVVEGPNYRADEAIIHVYEEGRFLTDMFPQKRHYLAGGQTMTEAGIKGNLWRDLYVSMGEPLDGGAWSVRLHVKPFVRWIWYGAMYMALGGLLAIVDRRYWRSRPEGEDKAESAPASQLSGTKQGAVSA